MRLVCSLLVFIATGASSLQAQSAADFLAEGRRLIAGGHLADALAAFRSATRADTANVAAWRGVGSALHRMERYPEALDALNRAASLSPRDLATRFNRGLTLSELGRLEDALTDLDSAVVLRPEFAPAWTERGATKALLGRMVEARADWQRAIALDSSYIWSRYYRGLAGIIEGDYRAAAADLDAVTARESLLGAYLWRWVAYRLDGRPAPPLPAPGTEWPGPIVSFLRGELDEQGLVAAARETRLAIDDRRLASAWFYIGQRHLAGRQAVAARDALRRVLELHVPRHAEVVAAEALLRRH